MTRVGSADISDSQSVRAMSKVKSAWQQLAQQSKRSNQSWSSVHQSSPIVLLRYLFKWQASIYRLIWLDVLIWLVLYYTVSFVYRFALNEGQKTTMEDLIRMTARWIGDVPVTFLLGFFVSTVVGRWWATYSAIPRLGGASSGIRTYIRNMSDQKQAERLRLDIGRYLNLAWLLCVRQYSGILTERHQLLKSVVSAVNRLKAEGINPEPIESQYKIFSKRQPNDFLQQQLNSVTDSKQQQQQLQQPSSAEEAASNIGQDLALFNEDPAVKATFGDLITASELQVFMQLARRHWQRTRQQYRPQWWIPLFWANALAERATFSGNVPGTDVYAKLVETIFGVGGQLTQLSDFAARKLPNVYLQVVIVAVYTTYFANIISVQFIDPSRAVSRGISGYWVDYYFPVFALLQLIFLIGWFKVALVVLDPFGTDDEDFPLGSIFSANLQAASEMCGNKSGLYPTKLQHTLKPLQQVEKEVGRRSKVNSKGLRNPDLCVHSDIGEWDGEDAEQGEEGEEVQLQQQQQLQQEEEEEESDVETIESDQN